MTATPTKEELAHPDVRAAFPWLPHAFDFAKKPKDYELADVLEAFNEAYNDSDPIFPVTIFDIPGRVADDEHVWLYTSEIQNQRCTHFHDWRSGQLTTIVELSLHKEDRAKQTLIFLDAVKRDLSEDRRSNEERFGTIPAAILQRCNVVHRNSPCRYAHNTTSFSPWDTYDPHGESKLSRIRSLQDFMCFCAELAKKARSEGGLVLLRAAPDEVRAERERKEGGKLLREALNALEAGDLDHSVSKARAAAHLLEHSCDLKRIAKGWGRAR